MLTDAFKNQKNRIERSIEAVLGNLSGSSSPICFDSDPSRKYSIGILHPQEDDENKSQTSINRKPNSLGLEVYLRKKESIKLRLDIHFSLYWRAIPNFEEQLATLTHKEVKENEAGEVRFRQKYIREDISTVSIDLTVNGNPQVHQEKLSLEVNKVLQEKIESLKKQIAATPTCWPENLTETPFEIKILSSKERYEKYLEVNYGKQKKEVPNWQIEVSTKVWPLNDGRVRLGIILSNTATDVAGLKHPQQTFSTKFTASCDEKYLSSKFAAASQDYRYESVSWGRGINCVLRIEGEGSLAVAETTPIHYQTRTKTVDVANSACNFKRLSTDESIDALEEINHWLKQYAQSWEDSNSTFSSDPSYKNRTSDLARFQTEIETYNRGIACLKEDSKLLAAFKMANNAFSKGSYPGWRLFQLVFIVSQLPSLMARESTAEELRKDLSIVDVLWFPTGGGKTEAYFGIIATSLFYDRLRGKTRGVTAWLRYPLRMLSIQQLQRLMEVVVYCNIVKNDSGEPSLRETESFSLGYYVGEKNTPNDLTYAKDKPPSKKIDELKRRIEQSSKEDNPLLVLQRCPNPACKSDDLCIEIDTTKVRIHHVCNVCKSDIPLFISDTEIYRYTPSIIVGTVDRLARAGQRSQFAHIFGRTRFACPDHGFVSFGKCLEQGVCKRSKSEYIDRGELYDPAPAFLLQDELHLLRESLGTYDSHYESFIDTLCSRIGTGLPPKRIAATATIEGYETHIRELYGRDARRFPVKGIGEHDTAYVEVYSEEPESRVFVGVMPTGSDTRDTVIQIMESLAKFSKSEKSKSKELDNLYDLMLTYVNQKNTASDIRSHWNDASEIQVLTGDRGLSEVRSTIGRIESDNHRDFENRLKFLVATSIISHGVDLERLNLMAFAGLPSNASDYIQASSRVGRKHVGLVFIVFRPENNRERNVYQRFYEYHDRLYQLVQPVPINRLSQSAVERTITGILGACILNILAYEKGQKYAGLERGDDFAKAHREGVISDDELIELAIDSIGLDTAGISADSYTLLKDQISGLVRSQRRLILNEEDYSTTRRMRPHPVSSLREVSEQVKFDLNYKSGQIVAKLFSNGGSKK